MKYQAKPVTVDAYRIISLGPVFSCDTYQSDGKLDKEGSRHAALSNGENVVIAGEMRARMEPVEGDYWVVQEDGYVYLNPRAVFERKYQLKAPESFSGAFDVNTSSLQPVPGKGTTA